MGECALVSESARLCEDAKAIQPPRAKRPLEHIARGQRELSLAVKLIAVISSQSIPD